MNYDDMTLMKYADGELDGKTAEQLKKDLLVDPQLQERLKVFTVTREALIKTKQAKIPEDLVTLINNYGQAPAQNDPVIPLTKKSSPTQVTGRVSKSGSPSWKASKLAIAASLIIGTLFGAQGLPLLMTSMAPQMIAVRGNDTNKIQRGSFILLESLATDPTENTIDFLYAGETFTIKTVTSFTNAEGKQCKLSQLDDDYIVACLEENNKWAIQ
jgi:hypothetical protein